MSRRPRRTCKPRCRGCSAPVSLLTHGSCVGAEWIHALVGERTPAAIVCLDPFRIVAWALKALIRRPVPAAALGSSRATTKPSIAISTATPAANIELFQATTVARWLGSWINRRKKPVRPINFGTNSITVHS